MDTKDKITFWGTLDVAARTMEEIPKDFQALFDSGRVRMRPEDIARMRGYLKRIAKTEKEIRATLKSFESLNK